MTKYSSEKTSIHEPVYVQEKQIFIFCRGIVPDTVYPALDADTATSLEDLAFAKSAYERAIEGNKQCEKDDEMWQNSFFF